MKTLVQSPKALGRALRDARKRHGLTQQQLANRAGVSQPTVSSVERGAHRVSLQVILRIMATLNLQLFLHTGQSPDTATAWQDRP